MHRTTDDVAVSASARSRWRAARPWLGSAARLGLTAVWLLAGAAKVGELAAGVAPALPVVFVTGVGSAWARGLAIDCGCFGSGGHLPTGQTTGYGPEILRDLGFLVPAGFLLRWPLTPVSVDNGLAGEDRLEGDDE